MMQTKMTSAKGLKGFTLIELMIAIAVLGILLAIAVPNYFEYVRQARRAEAQSQMLEIRLGAEKYRANNNTYPSTLDDAGFYNNDSATPPVPDDNDDPNDYYDYTITGATVGSSPTGSVYVIRATAVSGKSQVNDKTGDGTSCKELKLDQNGAKTPAGCWKK